MSDKELLRQQYAMQNRSEGTKPLVYLASSGIMLRTEGWIVRFGADGDPEISKEAQIALDIKMIPWKQD